MSLLEIHVAQRQWRPNLFDPHGYFRHMLNKGDLQYHEMIFLAEYKERYPLVFEEVRIEIYRQGGASLDPPPWPWLDRRCHAIFWALPRSLFNGLILFQLMVRRKLIVPNRIRRRYLERRQKTLRDPTIKNKLFAFMGVNLPRRIQIQNICANKIQRAYRAHRILHCLRIFLWVKIKEPRRRNRRKMKWSAKVIQRAYRCAKARELARGLQWLDRCLGEDTRQYDLNRWLLGRGWSIKRKDNIPKTAETKGLKRRRMSI